MFKEHKFVDGGVLDNIPVEEINKLDVEKTIAVNFLAGQKHNPKNAYEIVMKSIDLIISNRTQKSLEVSDFVIDLELPEANVFNIKKIDYCYNIGYITAITNIEKIKEII